MKYEGDQTIKVESISPEDFKKIYADYGYNEAIAKDPDSLSYVVQPTKNLRVIAIDDCKYAPDSDRSGGEISATKLAWIKAQIDNAKKNGITIIGMMHHGLVEHYGAQDDIAGPYLRNCVFLPAIPLLKRFCQVIIRTCIKPYDLVHHLVWFLAVSIIIGMLVNFRALLQTSIPFSCGSMMSNITRSAHFSSIFFKPSLPSAAVSTSYPS